MLKIVHVVSSFEQGGVQTGILYSIKELREKFDYTVLVYTADNEWLKDFPDEIKSNIIIIGSSNMFIASLKAFKILSKMKPDVVVSSLWKSVPVATVYKVFNPKICLCGFYHSCATIHFVDSFFLWLLAKLQDMSLADSNATSRFIEKNFGVKQPVIVPYLFDFTIPPKTKSFDPLEIKIAYFGRLTKLKGIERAILFCKLCKEAGINFQFDIYGMGDTEKYNNVIANNGLNNEVKIKSLLPLNEVQSTMQKYDFLLQLSNFEGMALSVVEALSCGLVPLVTPVGEIEHYTKDGVNAIWLDRDFDQSLHLLVKKLLNVLDNPEVYQKLSIAASQTFKNKKKYTESFTFGINDFFKSKK
jgi:glycosyltransferase involved in cell wall biosynthesis